MQKRLAIPEKEYQALFGLYIEAEQLKDWLAKEGLGPRDREELFQRLGKLSARVDIYNRERDRNDTK